MIAIIDYGAGNLSSVANALSKLGEKFKIVDNPKDAALAAGVILPGVGAFELSIRCLRKSGLDQAIMECVGKGVPLLGICLGFQMLFSVSYENGKHQGLGIFPGAVRRLPPGIKVPHMGWNQLEIKKASPLLNGIEDNSFFYFVHSYYVEPENPGLVTAYTDYGGIFASMVGQGNIHGVQFHPEKSSDLGLLLLKNFGEMVKNAHNSGN